MGKEDRSRVKFVVGVASWMQGFRCFPWLAVSFFLKDGMLVEPSALQLLQYSATLPMVAKPLYGILSDALYIRGQHRLPYISLGAFLQAISWLAIVLLPESSISISVLAAFLLLGNLGASFAEVASDAILAESGKNSDPPSGGGDLQSFAWASMAAGGIAGNLIGGISVSLVSPRAMFAVFSSLLAVQLLLTAAVAESSLNLPEKKKQISGIREQISDLRAALRIPEISRSIAWFSASYAAVPVLTGTMFFYQTEHLRLDSSAIGFSRVFGQAALLSWSVFYRKKLSGGRVPARDLLRALQAAVAALMVSDVLFVKGVYSAAAGVGVDWLYVVVFSGLQEVLHVFKFLPFSVLVARICPPGCEGSVMAVVMSAASLAMITGGYLGVALAAAAGVSRGGDFSGLPIALLVQAACTLLPLFWSSWIPADDVAGAGAGRAEMKKKKA